MQELRFRNGDQVRDADGAIGTVTRGLWLVNMQHEDEPAAAAYFVRYADGRHARRLQAELTLVIPDADDHGKPWLNEM